MINIIKQVLAILIISIIVISIVYIIFKFISIVYSKFENRQESIEVYLDLELNDSMIIYKEMEDDFFFKTYGYVKNENKKYDKSLISGYEIFSIEDSCYVIINSGDYFFIPCNCPTNIKPLKN